MNDLALLNKKASQFRNRHKQRVQKRKTKITESAEAVLVKRADQNIHLLSKTEGASQIQSNCEKLGIIVTQLFTENLSMWRLKPLID